MRTIVRLALLAVFLYQPAVLLAAEAPVWPQWRGPTRDGVVPKSVFEWPDNLKSVKPIWHVDLGDGYPSPVVSADRVFTVESQGGKEIVRAFDRATGKAIWSSDWAGQMAVPFFAMRNGSWVRSTPALDGDSLYVAGMKDLLVCLNAADGKERWRVDFVDRYKTPLPAFGQVCSPLVTANGVYIQAGASFVKIDKATGKTLWRILEDEGGTNGSAFSSPVTATIAGKAQILVQTRNDLAGVDEGSGKVLWKTAIPSFRGMNILSPTPFGDGVFTGTYGGATQLVALKADAAGELQSASAWKLKIEGYMSTPVVIDGHAYLHRRDRRMSCIDLKTGAEKWTAKPGFTDYVSLATDGKKILALDASGELALIRHNVEKLDIIERKKISDQETWAHIVVCGDEIFVRQQRGLTVFRWSGGE